MAIAVSQSEASSLWSPYLEPGETLLWQGRPGLKPDLSRINIIGFVVGLTFFWSGFRIAFGLESFPNGERTSIFSGIFLVLLTFVVVFHSVIWRSVINWHTSYAVTDKRAMSRLAILGTQDFRSWSLASLAFVELKRDWSPSVLFDTNEGGTFLTGRFFFPNVRKIGFEMIPDTETVYRLILKLRSEAK